MASHHVFPGGVVEAEADASAARAWDPRHLDKDATTHSLRVGAFRELFEETGLLFDATGRIVRRGAGVRGSPAQAAWMQRVASDAREFERLCAHAGADHDPTPCVPPLSSLLPWSRWQTPMTERRRFDTHFFVLPLADAEEAAAAQRSVFVEGSRGETVAADWATPREVLQAHARKEIRLAPPTVYTLCELARWPLLDDLVRLEAPRRVASGDATRAVRPVIVPIPHALPLASSASSPAVDRSIHSGAGVSTASMAAAASEGVIVALPGDPLHDTAPGRQPHRIAMDASVGVWRVSGFYSGSREEETAEVDADDTEDEAHRQSRILMAQRDLDLRASRL